MVKVQFSSEAITAFLYAVTIRLSTVLKITLCRLAESFMDEETLCGFCLESQTTIKYQFYSEWIVIWKGGDFFAYQENAMKRMYDKFRGYTI